MVGIDEVIHPKVSLHVTLLGCIVTDAAVSLRSLQSTLMYAVDRSVNWDMSTNNMIVAFSNGAGASEAGNMEVNEDGSRGAVHHVPGRAHTLRTEAHAACHARWRGCDQVRDRFYD